MAVRPIDGTWSKFVWNLGEKSESLARKFREGEACLRDLRLAVDAQPTLTPPNEPLTIEQLRKMDGEPVYLIVDDGYEPLEMWALIDVPEEDHIVLINNIGGRSAYYSDDDLERDHITVYRCPPEGEDNA